MDTLRRSPEGTRVCLWTQDTNLQARAELQGLPTLPARGTPPTDPHAFLDSLGIRPSELGPFEVDMDAGPLSPPLARVSPPPPVRAIDSRLLATHTAQHRRPPLLPQKTGTLSCSHLPPFEAILLIMEIHFPPAIIRRLSAFERLAHAAYDEVGLPQLDDLRQMTITVPVHPFPDLSVSILIADVDSPFVAVDVFPDPRTDLAASRRRLAQFRTHPA